MPDLASERRDAIAHRLDRGLPVVAGALAHEFHVSEDAIRRDLRALAEAGRCRRVYGGALPLSPAGMPLAARLQAGLPGKRALAQAALATLEAGELVFLDSSSANAELARVLPLDRGLSVATNSPDIAATLVQRALPRLLLLGGVVDTVLGGCVDASALESLGRLNIDRCFVGACAVSAQDGVSVLDPADAEFKRRVLAASTHRLALITADKLGSRAPHRIGAVGDFDRLVVEHHSAGEALEALVRVGGNLLRAAAPTP